MEMSGRVGLVENLRNVFRVIVGICVTLFSVGAWCFLLGDIDKTLRVEPTQNRHFIIFVVYLELSYQTVAVHTGDGFDKAKPGAIQGRKAKGLTETAGCLTYREV